MDYEQRLFDFNTVVYYDLAGNAKKHKTLARFLDTIYHGNLNGNEITI